MVHQNGGIQAQWQDSGAPNFYNDLYVNAYAGINATIQDMEPVPGGGAHYGSGVGAEERIQEILEGGGATTVSVAATSANKVEGDSGTTAFTFTATRSGSDLSGTSSVDYAVTGSTSVVGTAANAADFGGTLPSGNRELCR